MIAIVLLPLVAAAGWWMYTSHGRSPYPGTMPERTLYPVRGLDVSAHNGVIDFDAVARGRDSIDFVFVKATEGATFKDRRFLDNVRRARKAGLKVGAYHFFRFDVPGHLQALNLLHSVRGRNLDLPLVIDVEAWGNPSSQPTETVVRRIDEMARYIEQEGYQVMFYTNKDGLARFFSGIGSSRLMWICSLSGTPRGQWVIWQHSHRGRIEGIDGSVDINAFNGTRTDWELWLSTMPQAN